jgi:ABC-type branched-subunit amino acid transport system permease subunit
VALGLAITYGLMGVINMAHGELMMIGAYATYVVQNLFKQYLPGAVRLVHRGRPSRRPSWPPRWWARCWSAA